MAVERILQHHWSKLRQHCPASCPSCGPLRQALYQRLQHRRHQCQIHRHGQPRQIFQSSRTPIDGIGFQAHSIIGDVPSTLQANMEQFTALGIEIAITELDIRMTLLETAALLEQQRHDYQTVVSACMAVADCIGVTIWDYTDRVGLPITLSICHDPERLSWTRSRLPLMRTWSKNLHTTVLLLDLLLKKMKICQIIPWQL